MSRRVPPSLAIVAAGLLAAATIWAGATRPWQENAGAVLIGPDDPAVLASEQARRSGTPEVRDVSLTAAPATIDLGDRTVETWAFDGTVPGPEIRLRAGDVLRAQVRNELPEPLTIHWHGIALRNDMDGVPGLTQEPIQPGAELTYEFTVPHAGTYFYHPHTGTQLDRGLYGALIVEDRDPSVGASYDGDITVMLDDWIDGTGQTPDDVLAGLTSGAGAMDGMDMGGVHQMDMDMGAHMDGATSQSPLGDDTSDVEYPLFLVNGRSPDTPAEFSLPPGATARLRLINAGSDTPFRVAVGGTRLTVIEADGFPVEPVTVDTLLIGMGERYDVTVTIPDRAVVPLVAAVEGKEGRALGILRSGPGTLPAPAEDPAELNGELLTLSDLVATADVALPELPPDRTYTVSLNGDMANYRWGLAAPEDGGTTMPVREGERIRLVFENDTMMWHPIHLHGHTFQTVTTGSAGARKDTVIVPPMEKVTVDFVADNPGLWAIHCHNIYHAEAGMVTVLSYVR